ncbi:hypothetical protein AS156_16230 [Bradyrhizobium macuxiense]|uniref:Uncharacterized protein n=1 Tax=Bradyrhizobium macuxiense TaxID=1755647 RepID=A0A109JI49_9BRAD|nr:hypothetical protein AS156_16230 [Bradyrhizobium macuxiense]
MDIADLRDGHRKPLSQLQPVTALRGRSLTLSFFAASISDADFRLHRTPASAGTIQFVPLAILNWG